MSFSANTITAESLEKAITAILDGEVPIEFKCPVNAINEEGAPEWALPIFEAARKQLLKVWCCVGKVAKKLSPDCYCFEMKHHRWPLTRALSERGWGQWQSTVETRTREECAADGISYKRYRYAVHFWVSPEGGLALGKIKTQGKYIGGIRCRK